MFPEKRKRFAYDSNYTSKLEELIEQIMLDYGTELTLLAFSYVKDTSTAKDIVQNVFIKCYLNLPKFNGDSTIKTWLYKITINQCKDYLKSSYFKRMVFYKREETFMQPLLHTPENEVLRKTKQKELNRVLLKLKQKYREVLFLYYYKDFNVEEISSLLEMPANTVKTRLKRGREKLKSLLLEEGFNWIDQ